MPIYEYLCQSCGRRFEVKQKMSDPPISRCVHCGMAVMKVISPSAIMFKGSGWYVTDYSDKLKPPSQGESADKATDGAKDRKQEKEPASSKEAAPAAPPAETKGDTGSGSSGSPPPTPSSSPS